MWLLICLQRNSEDLGVISSSHRKAGAVYMLEEGKADRWVRGADSQPFSLTGKSKTVGYRL